MKQPELKLLLAKALDQADLCAKKHTNTFTNFLDPLSISKLMAAVKVRGINALPFGGYSGAERQMLGFFCEEISEDGFPITMLTITVNKGFSGQITHRDCLGAILSLGIDRAKIGDIKFEESGAHFFAHNDICEYIAQNLTKVGGAGVSVFMQPAADANFEETEPEQIRTTVASLRLDAIVGQCFKLSRANAQDLVAGEKVFVNWAAETRLSVQIKQDDVITLRGYGRIKIKEICGTTKKGRTAVIYYKY